MRYVPLHIPEASFTRPLTIFLPFSDEPETIGGSVHSNRFDVVIAGAGPAGSYAAFLLARAGARVALLDRARFPRDKVCGGGLSAKTLNLLEIDIAPVIHRRIRGAYLTYGNDNTLVRRLDHVAGSTVLRSEFDQRLLDAAKAAGAIFYPETPFRGAASVRCGGGRVAITTAKGCLETRHLIGADGVASAVRRSMFGPRAIRCAPAVEALVYVDPQALAPFADLALFDLCGMPQGYGWIFPKRDHFNVGVYSTFRSGSIRGHLQAFLGRYKALRSARAVTQRGFPIPVSSNAERVEADCVWLIGDAAGFADSVYGEGIYFALKSAQIAARTLLACGGHPPQGAFTTSLRREVLDELRYSRLLGRALFSRPSWSYRHIARSAIALPLFEGLITGDVSYRSCFYRMLTAVPRWLTGHRLKAETGLSL